MSKQRVVRFGSAAQLAGIVTEPGAGTCSDRPAVIVLTSGILHHVGANRLHVQLARRLAEAGFTTLCFDFSGVGDSESRRDHLSFEQSAPIETKEAIDYVGRVLGVRQAILVGLCSGADVAHLTALEDERVVGLGLLDPWAYRTLKYYAHYYLYRLVRPAMYVRWLRVRLARLGAALRPRREPDGPDPAMYDLPQYIRVFPPRERVAGDLEQFVRRRIELFFIFSDGLEEYNHQGQYRASFHEVDFKSYLREAHVPGAMHVFTALAHQEFVVRELTRWAESNFGGSNSDVPSADMAANPRAV